MNDMNNNEKVSIAGIRFKKVGRVYYYSPAGIELKVDDWVVVDTPRGQKLGQVVITPEQVLSSDLNEPLKSVVRKATPEDVKRAEEFSCKESEVLIEAGKIVSKLNLPMKLITSEYNLEGNHVTIFFKAADRIDFRELVKELNSHFKMRVELRQVGPRDVAKLVGGFGRCGRTLCCATFLDEFAPVSIKMAKQQNLPLNPMKIAGACGRLLCCLAYEAEPNEKNRTLAKEVPVDDDIELINDVSNAEETHNNEKPQEPKITTTEMPSEERGKETSA
jgi:cell fate regulator YaaT (PSP1 superfamily)